MMRVMLGVLATLLLATGCTSVAPDQGQEAVVIKYPWFFTFLGGVRETPVKTGRSYFAFSSSAIYVDIRPQQFVIHLDDFMSKEGVPLDFDAALRLRITDSVRAVRDFGVDPVEVVFNNVQYTFPRWYYNNIHKNFENIVRQAVRKHGMNETAISTTAIEAIDEEISTTLKKYIADAKLPVELIEFTVGKANPPDQIKHQRIATAEQEQRANTEKLRKLAEDERAKAETSRANADNAFRNAMQLSPEQYLRLEAIKMQEKVCVNPNAKCVFAGSGIAPVVDVGKN